MIDLWLKTRRTDATRKTYKRDIDKFLGFIGEKSLQMVTLEDLLGYQQLLESEGKRWNTQRKMLMAVRSLLGYGHRIGVLAVNVGAAYEMAEQEETLHQRILGLYQAMKLVNEFDAPRKDRLILKTLYWTAVRVSELCNMKWSDWLDDHDGGATVTVVGKRNKVRHISLDPTQWEELKALRRDAKDGDPVFQTRTGKPLVRSQVNRIVTRATKQAGIERNISPHWLRHAALTHWQQGGMSMPEAQAIAGHDDANTTIKYTHFASAVRPSKFIGLR